MEEGRKHQRCSIHWRSAIAIDGEASGQTIQCKTNDISVDGVSVVCHRNVAIGQTLTVYLLIDPGNALSPPVIFEAQGKVMNTVLSGKQGGFRLGIQFTKFARDSQQLLKNNLPRDVVKPERLVTGGSPAPAEVAPPESNTAGVAPPEAKPPAEAAALDADAVPVEDTTPPT